MKALVVGADKTPIFEYVDFTSDFLLLDDGPLIDALALPNTRKEISLSRPITHFDVSKHRLNPLHEMDYRRAREFVSVIDAIYPEGESTLTKENARFELLTVLLDEPTYLHKLIGEPRDKKDTGKLKAYQMIQTLLLSPVLKTVLCKATNFSLKGIVLARLDRAVLGDFDAFVLASLLISQFQGQVIIPDFGFYGREHHISLIRQNRLVAGVTTLSQVSKDLQQALLTIEDKIPSRTTADDAETLAKYKGLRPDLTRSDNPYNIFINEAING